MASEENQKQFNSRDSTREYSCPVCLEEFQDPKILPVCNHNVCRQCLEKMVGIIIPASIQCPVCRQESLVVEEGVAHLETNTSLVDNLKQINVEKKKIENLKAVETARDKIEILGKLLEDFSSKKEQRIRDAEEVKEELRLTAVRLIDVIRKKENEVYQELDNAVNEQLKIYQDQQSEVESLLKKTKSFVVTAEEALKQGEISELNTAPESDFVEARAHEELICLASMKIRFEPNKMVIENFEKEGIGHVRVPDYASTKAAMYNGSVPLVVPRPVEVIRKITPSELGFESFSPLTIATDGRDYLAVSDPENNNILLLNNRGTLLRRIVSATTTAMMFSGVAFTKDNQLIAVNGGRDIHFLNPLDGSFKVTYKGNPSSGLKYCFLTTDMQGRILLTCEPSTKTSRPCVVVYSDTPLGSPELTLGFSGNGSLLFPFKAWCLKGEYFVSDMEKGCIMVYDERGDFIRHFGGKDAKVTGPGSAGHLVLPTGMAPNPQNDTFLVCDWGSSTVQIYKLDGTFIGVFSVDGRPTDIAIFEDGTVVVSSKDDQWIKILSVYV